MNNARNRTTTRRALACAGALTLALAGGTALAQDLESELQEKRSKLETAEDQARLLTTLLDERLTASERSGTGAPSRLRRRVGTSSDSQEEADVAALQPRPTLFERAAADGVAVTRVGPAAFDGAGLTLAGLRGGAYAAAETLGERVAAASAAARQPGRSLTYVYIGDLDSTGHRHGATSEAWRQELASVDRFAQQLAEALPAGTTLLITSDHGMVDIPPSRRYDLAADPVLDAGVETLTGDPRGGFVHARAGAAGDVLAAWTERLGADFWVLPTDEAVALGLFGEVTEVVRPRLGDVVFASRGPATLLDSRIAPAVLLELLGGHGSVTDDELAVPLLTYRS